MDICKLQKELPFAGIVTIDKKYLMGYYGHINEDYYTQVLKAMATQFGLSGRMFHEEYKEFDN